MQDPISSFQSIQDNNLLLHHHQQQIVKCPRCESTNTKFCYYNNYNLSQPRHFCKSCRRYWTKGGTLRNVPVGGGSRKNSSSKRPSSSDSSSTASSSNPKRAKDPKPQPQPQPVSAAYPNPTRVEAPAAAAEDRMLEISGTFSSLLQSSGNLLDGFGSGEIEDPNPNAVADPNQQQQQQQGESLLGWVGGWPDLAIYTSPGSSFQ